MIEQFSPALLGCWGHGTELYNFGILTLLPCSQHSAIELFLARKHLSDSSLPDMMCLSNHSRVASAQGSTASSDVILAVSD